MPWMAAQTFWLVVDIEDVMNSVNFMVIRRRKGCHGWLKPFWLFVDINGATVA